MKINEIDYASDIVTPDFDISTAVVKGTMENNDVLYISDNSHEIYLFTKDNVVAAYVAVTKQSYNGYRRIEGIENISFPKGAVTALCVFLITKLKYRLMLDSNEPLTYSGLQWVTKLIFNGTRGLNIQDQSGNIPDAKTLYNEWNNARLNHIVGPTSVFIENRNIPEKPLFESREREQGILSPAYRYFGDKDID